MRTIRHAWTRLLARWRAEWNEDLARTRAATEAAEMEFRRSLQFAIERLEKTEDLARSTRRDLDALAERANQDKQTILELQQRIDIIDMVFDGGHSFW